MRSMATGLSGRQVRNKKAMALKIRPAGQEDADVVLSMAEVDS